MNWELRRFAKWVKRFGGSERRNWFKMVTVADLREAVVGPAVPASETDGEGCVFGIFGRLFDEAFPRFPMCNDAERLFDRLDGRVSRQLIKSIMAAYDDGRVEVACQLLIDSLGGIGRQLRIPSGAVTSSVRHPTSLFLVVA